MNMLPLASIGHPSQLFSQEVLIVHSSLITWIKNDHLIAASQDILLVGDFRELAVKLFKEQMSISLFLGSHPVSVSSAPLLL